MNAGLRPDQQGVDQTQPGGFQRAFQRLAAARVHHTHPDFRQAFGGIEQLVVAQGFVGHQGLGQLRAMDAQFLDRRHHLGFALDDHVALLVDTACVEDQATLDLVERLHRDRHGQGIADVHRLEEPQALAEVDRPRAGEARPKHRRDQRGTQHSVRDDLVEVAALGVERVDVRRIHVPGDSGEQLNVAVGDAAHQARPVAHTDPCKGVVLQELRRWVDLNDLGVHGSTHHVVAGVDEDDIAGHGARGIAAEQCGHCAHIGDRDELMLWRARCCVIK